MCILSLNCQSINVKFDKMKMFIDYLNDQSPFSVKYIQESWTHNELDNNYFSIPNDTMVNQNRRLSTHGGRITYIHNDFAHRELNNELPNTTTATDDISY